jgi:hypothetical protein
MTLEEILASHGLEGVDLMDAVGEIEEHLELKRLPDSEWVIGNEHMRRTIVGFIAPMVVGRWMAKNRDYKGQQMFLGVKAQFIDINRKFWKLKSILWDGNEPEFESAEEILFDFIGHSLMAIYFQRHPEEWDTTIARLTESAPNLHALKQDLDG